MEESETGDGSVEFGSGWTMLPAMVLHDNELGLEG